MDRHDPPQRPSDPPQVWVPPSARDRPGISVALCTWNGERWLGRFFDSLLAQERQPCELVVSDDASTDGTVAIVRAFADRAPFPVGVEINPRRLGSTGNFESALARCRGRYVALADQDDLWYPAKLRILGEALETDPTLTMVFSDADLIGTDERRLGTTLWDTRRVGRVLRRNEVVPEVLLARRGLATGCTMMVRRRAVDAALPFPACLTDERAPMRHDRWLSLVAAAVGTVRAVPQPLMGFRVHPAQQTGVLLGAGLWVAVGRAGRAVLVGDPLLSAEGHLVRARQLAEAADRAEEVGDFNEAVTLRRVADQHRGRLLPGTSPVRRLGQVGALLRGGAYPGDAFGAGAVIADAVRAIRPRHAGAVG